jgi:DNA-binding beta-propeller fold protein YncE
VSGNITLPGEGPEDLAFDEAGKRLFQAIKLADSLAVIDLKENKVSAKWPTAPARLPHGIALIPEAHAIAIAGGNGQLVLMSQADGKILASAEMPEKVDEIAYDREWHRLYCASALGKLAVFQVGTESLEKVAEVTTSPGAKSVAVDPKTHRVWIAFVKSDECYVQPFTAVSH